MLRSPIVFLSLLRALAWFLWSTPVSATKSKPKPPRRPTLAYSVGPVPDHIFAVVRTSWFKQGRPVEVDEFQIEESDDALKAFQYVVEQALRQGADVCVMSTYPPEAVGVPTD